MRVHVSESSACSYRPIASCFRIVRPLPKVAHRGAQCWSVRVKHRKKISPSYSVVRMGFCGTLCFALEVSDIYIWVLWLPHSQCGKKCERAAALVHRHHHSNSILWSILACVRWRVFSPVSILCVLVSSLASEYRVSSCVNQDLGKLMVSRPTALHWLFAMP